MASRASILPSDRMLIVMVGLPARGKSYMAKKIYHYLQHLQIICKIFNCGSYRRIATKDSTVGKASANFFDPDNSGGAKIRRQCCIDAMYDIISWFNRNGQIAILDATNTTMKRRQLIREFFSNKKSQLKYNYNVSILYIESICNDESVIHNNIISAKLKNADYCTVDTQKALRDFKKRIKMYKKAYVEVGTNDGSFIKVINVGNEVNGYQINDYISCIIFDFLMCLYATHSEEDNDYSFLQSDNDKSKSLTSSIIEKSKALLNAGIISSIFIGFSLNLPHFINSFYFGDISIFIDLHSVLCAILFIYGIYTLIHYRFSIYSITYSFILFLVSIIYGILFYSMNIFILLILIIVVLPYLFYKLSIIKKQKNEIDSKYNLLCCNSNKLKKDSNIIFALIVFLFIFIIFITAGTTVNINNCNDDENNKLCQLFKIHLKLQKEYYPVAMYHGLKDNFDVFCNLDEVHLIDMNIRKLMF